MSEDSITQVANMINAKGGNRNQRRRLERRLTKVENITYYAQKRLDKSAYAEYQRRVEQNYVHFFACLGLCMIEDYHWNEKAENDHGQISSLFERVNKTIVKYADEGLETKDLIELLEQKTGIELVPDLSK